MTRLLLALGALWRRAFPHGDPALKRALARALVREHRLGTEVTRLALENKHMGIALVTAERLLQGVCAMAAGPAEASEAEEPRHRGRRAV